MNIIENIGRFLAVKVPQSPSLNVAMVYDSLTGWSNAAEFCGHLRKIMHCDDCRVSACEIGKLCQGKWLPAAIRAAAEADIILVSLATPQNLPVPLCVWIDIWLPRRVPFKGALVGILPEAYDCAQHSAHEYLRAVAHRGKLDFFSKLVKSP